MSKAVYLFIEHYHPIEWTYFTQSLEQELGLLGKLNTNLNWCCSLASETKLWPIVIYNAELDPTNLSRIWAFCIQLVHKDDMEMQARVHWICSNRFLDFSESKNFERDIVDTCFHASRVTDHNMTKQHGFPTTWRESGNGQTD